MLKVILPLMIAGTLVATQAWGRDLNSEYESVTFQLGAKKITAFVADNDESRAKGLMQIEKLKPDEGMIFVFEQEQILSFWMKNTLMPLSIGFFDSKATLIDIQEMTVPPVTENYPKTYQSRGPAVLALEMNPGWFKANKILKGAKLRLIGSAKSKLLNKQIMNNPTHRP